MAEPASPRRLPTTRQGAAVLAALRSSGTFRSAQDIHAELRAGGAPVGLATVYRHLQLLAEHGVIDTLQAADGQTVYRHCRSDDHHHHIVCRRCGTSEEIEGPEVERWAESAARRLGYTDITHTVEIFGLCATCSAAGGH
ncbi:MAG TPA: Fur family transcriptional regulator [Acidimicrobiales bacterium]|nr:Fur family transcriptional regulator [Acidimicrobiales bacterium]